MNANRRLAAALVAALLPGAFLAAWLLRTAPSHGVARPIELPRTLGSWVGEVDQEFAPGIVERLDVDSYVLRRYEAPGRTPIWLYAGFYSQLGGFGGKYHDPATCYPGQGWEIVDYRPIEIALADRDTFSAMHMYVQRGDYRQSVIYWFQPAGRWPAIRGLEELLRPLDAMAGRPQYAFVRLSTPAALHISPTDDLSAFAATIGPAVRQAVERGRELASLPGELAGSASN